MAQSFIETQFPVSKLSKESYKERKATNSQTLTGLGKWWGRKPLILVRAAILGLLLPATDNPKKDREVFLRLLTMDSEGLWYRKSKQIALKDVYELLDSSERKKWFDADLTGMRPKPKSALSSEDREALQYLAFSRLSYDDKLTYCDRPEHVNGPPEQAWAEINAYLGTTAYSLSELIQQLGEQQFGHSPYVGDAFSGGGSVPFEAARIGCKTYGSDLNPVAGLLTWASLNIIGGGEEAIQRLAQAQQSVYDAVEQKVQEWGIEHNEAGWRADIYLYCNETKCPECGWSVPLAPSWVIGKKTNTVAKLVPDEDRWCFNIEIWSGVSAKAMKDAKDTWTVKDSDFRCPNCPQTTPISVLRGDRRTKEAVQYGLRLWDSSDLVPRPGDVFQERLYCIRWVETYIDSKGREKTRHHYRAPDEHDLRREQIILEKLSENLLDWQQQGYIPNREIEPGDETSRLLRERGWNCWHHLFNPRQLLTLGTLMAECLPYVEEPDVFAGLILGISRCADYNARLSRWHPRSIGDKSEQVFSNQALNTLFNYATRTVLSLGSAFFLDITAEETSNQSKVEPVDARSVQEVCDFWITDPPYADAINYHELTEFFLAWYGLHLSKIFPHWYTDSKRALAIVGRNEGFRKSMADCYRNLAEHMPDNGYQVVMFTHQDAGVWADLALILWASGLRVTAAWCIGTETSSALKTGNYVQGTVLLILRKQTSDDTAFLDEVYPKVELEVKRQLDSMLALEDEEDPNFDDTDYQLAAYAAALRVLTQYRNIEDIDVAYELSKPRKKSDKSEIENIIDEAVKIACDYLVPKGFDTFVWKTLTPEERFYLKGLDIESHGEYRSGAYQELARGFGLKDYKPFLESGKANQTRLKTASEFGTKNLNDVGFGASLVRNTLFAIRETVCNESAQQGKSWLRTEVNDYWNQRKNAIEILHYLATMSFKLPSWTKDAEAAKLLAGALENDSV